MVSHRADTIDLHLTKFHTTHTADHYVLDFRPIARDGLRRQIRCLTARGMILLTTSE
jgi:hypothetical protein